MQRDENASEECFVFFLEWQSKTIDDGPKDFQQLRNTIMSLGFVDELEENVVY